MGLNTRAQILRIPFSYRFRYPKPYHFLIGSVTFFLSISPWASMPSAWNQIAHPGWRCLTMCLEDKMCQEDKMCEEQGMQSQWTMPRKPCAKNQNSPANSVRVLSTSCVHDCLCSLRFQDELETELQETRAILDAKFQWPWQLHIIMATHNSKRGLDQQTHNLSSRATAPYLCGASVSVKKHTTSIGQSMIPCVHMQDRCSQPGCSKQKRTSKDKLKPND